jgi:hypothetical protein
VKRRQFITLPVAALIAWLAEPLAAPSMAVWQVDV